MPQRKCSRQRICLLGFGHESGRDWYCGHPERFLSSCPTLAAVLWGCCGDFCINDGLYIAPRTAPCTSFFSKNSTSCQQTIACAPLLFQQAPSVNSSKPQFLSRPEAPLLELIDKHSMPDHEFVTLCHRCLDKFLIHGPAAFRRMFS